VSEPADAEAQTVEPAAEPEPDSKPEAVEAEPEAKLEPEEPPQRKRRRSVESPLEHAVNVLITNRRFSLPKTVPAPDVVKSPVQLTSILTAVQEHTLATTAQLQLELYRMIANAVMAEQVGKTDAVKLLGIVDATIDAVPDPEAGPKRRRR